MPYLNILWDISYLDNTNSLFFCFVLFCFVFFILDTQHWNFTVGCYVILNLCATFTIKGPVCRIWWHLEETLQCGYSEHQTGLHQTIKLLFVQCWIWCSCPSDVFNIITLGSTATLLCAVVRGVSSVLLLHSPADWSWADMWSHGEADTNNND